VNLSKKLDDFDADSKDQADENGIDNEEANEDGVAVIFDTDDEDASEFEEDEEEQDLSDNEQINGDNELQDDKDDRVILQPHTVSNNVQIVHPADVDAHWLQRIVSKYYTDALESQNIANSIFDILEKSSDIRDCENSLVELFNYQHFDLTQLLVRNKLVIYWCTLYARAGQDDAKRTQVEADMAVGGHSSILQQLRADKSVK